MKIYTDGACSENPGPGGWAAVIALEDRLETISGNEAYTTNNRMELTSVIKALEKAQELGATSVEIVSDSAYVVNAVLFNWIDKWRMNNWVTTKGEQVKNKDLWKKLVRLFETGVRIKFTKVKGHSGNTLNEMVDKLAKQEIRKVVAGE